MFKRLFRVYAHLYHSHFPKVASLGEEAHLNTSFKHAILFIHEFNLVDKKELAPLDELIEQMLGSDVAGRSISPDLNHPIQSQPLQHPHEKTLVTTMDTS